MKPRHGTGLILRTFADRQIIFVHLLPSRSTWGPKWVGPRGAQVGPSQKFGTPKNPKNKNSQNQNPFCPECRQYFSMPEKGVPAPFGALPAHFLRGPEKSKNCQNFAYFPWWANGPYSPGLGPLLLSTRGGAIGMFSSFLTISGGPPTAGPPTSPWWQKT